MRSQAPLRRSDWAKALWLIVVGPRPMGVFSVVLSHGSGQFRLGVRNGIRETSSIGKRKAHFITMVNKEQRLSAAGNTHVVYDESLNITGLDMIRIADEFLGV